MRLALACIFGHVWTFNSQANYPIPPGYFIAARGPSVGAAEKPQPRLRHSLLRQAHRNSALTASGTERDAQAAANGTNGSEASALNGTDGSNATAENSTANDTEDTPTAAPARNGFSGNPYDGVLAYPHTEQSNPPVELHLDVEKVVSIECLRRMINDPAHRCTPSQLLGVTANATTPPPPESMLKAKEAMELAREAEQSAIAAARAAEAAAEAVAGQPPCPPNASTASEANASTANESVALVRTQHSLSPTSIYPNAHPLAPAAASSPPAPSPTSARFFAASPPVGVVVHHKLRRSDNLHQM